MTESRQQRRARERAEAKAANRPGPDLPPPPPPPRPGGVGVVEVELGRCVDADNPDASDGVSWVAEWGLADSPTGTEDSAYDLSSLVASIIGNIRAEWAEGYDEIRIEWILGGDEPPGRTVWDAVAEAGVELPDRLPDVPNQAVPSTDGRA